MGDGVTGAVDGTGVGGEDDCTVKDTRNALIRKDKYVHTSRQPNH